MHFHKLSIFNHCVQVFGGDSTLMQESGKGMYVDSSRGVDITQTDMKKSMQQKSKEAKKFAKV